ncbi:MAG TPA: energy transducer TonB [Candidatus Acidoferrum sp.]|jgi:TonB family protein|nr:energy transducer TonB [Candidatus Acidoferrum sp.]
MDTMTPERHPGEIPQAAPALRLLVEMPSWPRVFFGNLRDRIFPRRLPPLELRSAPAPFWPDVFVKRALPFGRFVQSCVYHVIAIALLIGANRFITLQPQVVAMPTFDHTQAIYYQASEYLPPLDTRTEQAPRPAKAEPDLSKQAFARQPIISVPPEADNRSQTIVTPPSVKLRHEVALPNIVAWSEEMLQKMEKPRLAIPPAPLTLAGDISRIGPQLDNSVVAPPPDAEDLAHRRNSSALQASVVAPPPSVETASARPLGDLNIGRSSVIAPAPQLQVGEQRTLSASRSSLVGAAQVVPPPPSVSAATSGGSFGSRGHMIALNLHPAVGAPSNPPSGNRRGNFAAAPDGHSAAADSYANGSGKAGSGGSSRKAAGDLPAGLYVGKSAEKTSPTAGDPGQVSNSAAPNLMASVRPPRVSSAPSRPMQPESAAKLSEAEREVFGDRKFYALTLNMPNLNSAVGSWIIHFAEVNHDSSSRDSNAPAENLSQPAATRKVDPAYPLQLMRANVAGTVILYAIIHADGKVGNVRVLRGVDDRLDQFAREAVAQWQFQPATKNGTPVDVEATFQIPFRPTRAGF